MKTNLSALSNLLLTFPFIYALYKPEYNIDFIYDTGVVLFIAEFLSIHSSGMLANFSTTNVKIKAPLLAFYTLIIVIILATTNSPQIMYFLIVSFITKLLVHKNTLIDESFVKPLIVLVSTVFIVTLASGILESLIPLPEYVLAQRPDNVEGIFVEVPQILLIWGIIYPLGLFLISFADIPSQERVQNKT